MIQISLHGHGWLRSCLGSPPAGDTLPLPGCSHPPPQEAHTPPRPAGGQFSATGARAGGVHKDLALPVPQLLASTPMCPSASFHVYKMGQQRTCLPHESAGGREEAELTHRWTDAQTDTSHETAAQPKRPCGQRLHTCVHIHVQPLGRRRGRSKGHQDSRRRPEPW